MEFTYRVSDAEVREAFWLNFWNTPRTLFVGAMLLAALVDGLWLIAEAGSGLLDGKGVNRSLASDLGYDQWLILAVIVGVLAAFLIALPRRAVRMFRKFPGSDGEVSAKVTPAGLETRVGTAGGSAFNWSIYEFWREGKSVLIFKIRSGQYQMLPMAGLTEAQRVELRQILTASLPKR